MKKTLYILKKRKMLLKFTLDSRVLANFLSLSPCIQSNTTLFQEFIVTICLIIALSLTKGKIRKTKIMPHFHIITLFSVLNTNTTL